MDRFATVLLAALLGASPAAIGHPATELYIPIGESPGISHVKSHIGRIQSLGPQQRGFTIQAPDGPKYIAFDPGTKIYLQYEDPARANELGAYSDCRADRMAEAYVADDGTVPWVKVRIPR